MTIQITRPEVEALINQRLQSGAFKNAEDVILQALRSVQTQTQSDAPPVKSSEELFAPLRGLNLDFRSCGPNSDAPL